ncbi:PEP-CTERM sorting domain-containing protein [bacterium]|nr:MAG: PEP-CTERM sorting domain-containing protein [bacterium]
MSMKILSVFALSLVLGAAHAAADPVGVSHTVTGTSGNYELDFTLTNSTGNDNVNLYFFGVSLPGAITGNPVGIDGNFPFNPGSFGGADFEYPTTWIDYDSYSTLVQNGISLSGFKLRLTDLAPPTSVNWFAFGYDQTNSYDGHGSFSPEDSMIWNPGFSGTVTTQAVPEPASMAALGLGGLALLRRRCKA